MKDNRKTKAHLIHELAELRQRITTLEDLKADHKRVEVALRESEEQFRQWSAATFEGIALHDQHQILDANPKMAEVFGYKLSEFIGHNILDLIAPQSRDLVLK